MNAGTLHLRNVYDVVVYGANIAGIGYATTLAACGRSVLVLNRSGFCGGMITESLRCRQLVHDLDASSRSLRLAASASFKLPPGMTPAMTGQLLDPEKVKYALQTELEQSSADVLMHIVPEQVVMEADGVWTVGLLGKEGRLAVRARQCVDATEDLELAILAGWSRLVQKQLLNVFLTAPNHPVDLLRLGASERLQLEDGRFWMSIPIVPDGGRDEELEALQVTDRLRTMLEGAGARLQILPLRGETTYSFVKSAGADPRFVVLDELLGFQYGPSEQLLRAAACEKVMINNSGIESA
jgi:hypothetical protein